MSLIPSMREEFVRYKATAEKAMAQLEDAQLFAIPAPEANSIAVICGHVSGNLRSRFTDFLTSDGEKPWRQRDEEFENRRVSRDELLAKWEQGWQVLVDALDGLSDDDLGRQVMIRAQPHTVADALLRALAHVASHVGQIVYAAKLLRGAEWTTLSIARGQSPR